MARIRNSVCGLGVSLCLLLHVTILFNVALGSRVGVCYGLLGNNLPRPWEVVQLYKQNNIDKMRIYGPRDDVLNALRGSGIQVMLGVPDEELEMIARDGQYAGDWTYRHVIRYFPDVHFNYIAVGNERLPWQPEARFVLGAMKNIHAALAAQNLHGRIKVSTAVNGAVLTNDHVPSAAAFKMDMEGILQFLRKTGSPVLYNAYPYFIYKSGAVSLKYALGKGGRRGPYRSLFAATVDAMYAALEKAGARDLEVVVSETGWPSAGNASATIDNAASYNWNVINHAGDGTHKRPFKPVETYLFAMFNENQKTGESTEKHFGLFYPNKTPVYPLQF